MVVTSSPPSWWTVHKRWLISSLCLSTSICSVHHCYLCLPRLHENHLFNWEQVVELVRCKPMKCFDDEVMNIWKSYMWTAEWKIKWRMITTSFPGFSPTRPTLRRAGRREPWERGWGWSSQFRIFITSSSSFRGFTTNLFNDLLPVGLLA